MLGRIVFILTFLFVLTREYLDNDYLLVTILLIVLWYFLFFKNRIRHK